MNALTKTGTCVMLLMAALLTLTACGGNGNEIEEEPDWDAKADHTLLMYMMGDNNLSSYLEGNVRQAQNAIRDSVKAGRINLLVFKDTNKNNDNLPSLCWIHRSSATTLDTVPLLTYDHEIDACDPDIVREVITTAFAQFGGTMKGMVIASHAKGWVPLLADKNYGASQSAKRNAIGLDSSTGTGQSGSLELWDLTDALSQAGIRLDYLIMDVCYAGTAEVAYQLRDVVHYMVGGTTEVQAAGMPYLNVVTRLASCQTASDLPEALAYGAKCYFDENAPYNQASRLGATIAVYDLTSMTTLAQAYQRLLAANAERLSALAAMAYTDPDQLASWSEQFQRYGRHESVATRYYYFDAKDYIDYLGEMDAADATTASQALSEVVVKEYHDTRFYAIDIDHSCGLALTIPQLLELANTTAYNSYFSPYSYSNLVNAYAMTDWAKATL